jgi:hypothetical protein
MDVRSIGQAIRLVKAFVLNEHISATIFTFLGTDVNNCQPEYAFYAQMP